VNI
jgi:hypothetical protein